MATFIAVAEIDPSRNELTQAFVRSTQEDAEDMCKANSKPNEVWVVFELVECARAVALSPKLERSREPETKGQPRKFVPENQ